jgi:hypothetical protein
VLIKAPQGSKIEVYDDEKLRNYLLTLGHKDEEIAPFRM